MARWIVWFCETYDGGYVECVGSDSTFPVDGRKSINTIIRDIKKLGAYRYRSRFTKGFKVYQGNTLLTAKPCTKLILID